MKKIFVLLFFFIATTAIAQRHVTVTYKTDSFTVLLGEGNLNSLSIKRDSTSNERLVIKLEEWAQERTMNRTFSFVGDNGNPALEIKEGKVPGEYTISSKELLAALKGNTYTLYTIALPKDPELAARIRIRRLFVCKINLQ